MESKQNLILGSSSPSRIELLKRIFHTFEIIKPDIEEPSSGFSSPREQVALISWLKGQEVSFQVGDGIIIAADTIGWIDGKPLLKPLDRDDAKDMISRMSGRDHELWTGVVLWHKPTNLQMCWQEQSIVSFKKVIPEEIEHYLETRSWKNHSGSYAIEEENDPWVKISKGSITNVIGLPLESLLINLKKFEKMLAIDHF
ncbi:MAG: septum formation protein Maf [Planctomycetota bacterium]|jgi:septum formation protein|nr:septum formation protein Maf [Gemmataceae bacterium]MCY2969092.1 Maf family protein [Planctomycetota bacterium]MBJ7496646.1 septum formation protein Maf [Gemmataceae bacterium]MSR49017.1 septum formation protein Maf [Gemmataceae bacterium]RLS60442.1 MAG: septum formation protein Maf [Planctomycetota bacterium]